MVACIGPLCQTNRSLVILVVAPVALGIRVGFGASRVVKEREFKKVREEAKERERTGNIKRKISGHMSMQIIAL